MNITENTRIKSGTITHEGRKFLYTMIISPKYSCNVEEVFRPTDPTNNDVTLIVHSKQGTIVDSMQRTYSRIDCPYLTDVVKAALAEFKEDRV